MTSRWPFIRRLKIINVESVIEKAFRYFEMLIVSALLVVIARVVSGAVANALMAILSALCSMYITLPTARWALEPTPYSKGSEFLRSGTVAIVGLAASWALVLFMYTLIVISMISYTFQIDGGNAREKFHDWYVAGQITNCMRPPIGLEEAERCVDRVKRSNMPLPRSRAFED